MLLCLTAPTRRSIRRGQDVGRRPRRNSERSTHPESTRRSRIQLPDHRGSFLSQRQVLCPRRAGWWVHQTLPPPGSSARPSEPPATRRPRPRWPHVHRKSECHSRSVLELSRLSNRLRSVQFYPNQAIGAQYSPRRPGGRASSIRRGGRRRSQRSPSETQADGDLRWLARDRGRAQSVRRPRPRSQQATL